MTTKPMIFLVNNNFIVHLCFCLVDHLAQIPRCYKLTGLTSASYDANCSQFTKQSLKTSHQQATLFQPMNLYVSTQFAFTKQKVFFSSHRGDFRKKEIISERRKVRPTVLWRKKVLFQWCFLLSLLKFLDDFQTHRKSFCSQLWQYVSVLD